LARFSDSVPEVVMVPPLRPEPAVHPKCLDLRQQ
jgi:hypothetical protein